MGAVSLQHGPPGRFCGLTAPSYLGRKGGLAMRSWVVGVVWGLMAQGPPPSLELAGGCWLAVRSSLVLGSQGDPHDAPCTLQAAGPREAATPTTRPGAGSGNGSAEPAPRSRALLRPPSQASPPCPSTQAALTEAIDVCAEQLGCVTIPLGTKVTAPLSVQRGSAKRA